MLEEYQFLFIALSYLVAFGALFTLTAACIVRYRKTHKIFTHLRQDICQNLHPKNPI